MNTLALPLQDFSFTLVQLFLMQQGITVLVQIPAHYTSITSPSAVNNKYTTYKPYNHEVLGYQDITALMVQINFLNTSLGQRDNCLDVGTSLLQWTEDKLSNQHT